MASTVNPKLAKGLNPQAPRPVPPRPSRPAAVVGIVADDK